jgi:hypothetical protein
MATLEAMAAGLPVLGNRHPSSPVEHGVSGFLSDEPEELNSYARLLIRDKDLAGRMGAAARRSVIERFSIQRFATRFKKSIETAKAKWETRKISDSCFSPEKNEEKLNQYRGGQFLPLSEKFRNCIRSGEIEKAVSVLDEIMRLLELPRDICISSLDDLIQLVMKVSERLVGLEDRKSAELLLKASLTLAEGERSS